MPDLPTGTVTFLFTDIEGSTKLLHELGAEAYSAALAEHRRLLRDAFTRHAGVEVDTQGDAFFVAFASATGALDAAREAQSALRAGPIRVRMGIHTGMPHLGPEGYVGQDVHLGARIAAAGHGGQVLMSKETRELVDVEVADLGEHRLKDFAAPVWIYQLGRERFPPLRTISNTNLPRPASSFVGREREVADIGALLNDGARLLTLTGPGGSGKTRLAIEAAAELVPNFRNGVFWVDLAPLRDPALVTATIGQTLGAKDGLAGHIGERQMLLVLDNLEQIVEAAPELSTLLSACPNLRIVDTSRELLRVQGEVEYAVPPLATSEAVELFTARAGLPPSDTIAELCRRLDNLPLAVELAAARTSILSPTHILERIGKRLDLLRGGRDADPRQQTLRATIEWSYDLLSPTQQALFARLSVFAGGWTIEAAEQIAEAELDDLQSLVDKSLVRHAADRFSMLETIREFAAERLTESGAADELDRRHAIHFLAVAEEAEPSLTSASPDDVLARLERDHDNLRAALDWLVGAGETERALRIAGASAEFWSGREHVPEGGRYLESVLLLDDRPTAPRAKALIGAAHMAHDAGDIETAKLRAGEAAALCRRLGDAWGTAHATLWLGRVAAAEGEFTSARQLFEESTRLLSEVGDDSNSLFARRLLAWTYNEMGDRPGARALHEQNLGLARAQGDRAIEATTLGGLASYAIDEGRSEDGLSLATAHLRIFVDLGNRSGVAAALFRCAGAHALAGRAATATQLVSCAERAHSDFGIAVQPYLDEENRDTLSLIHKQLDESAFSAAWARGQALTLEEAVALALSEEPSGARK